MANSLLVLMPHEQTHGAFSILKEKREKLHYVHSASLAYEDGFVFMSGPFAEWL